MKKYKFIVLVFVCLFFMVGYSFAQTKLIPTNNNGGYTVTFVKSLSESKKNKVVSIRGHVYDLKTNLPLSDVEVRDGCLFLKTLADGFYSFKTRNSREDSFLIEVYKKDFLSIDTEYIDSYGNKEIIVDFYVDRHNGFLDNCPVSRTIEETPEE